jgi:beta-galactosidase GanA
MAEVGKQLSDRQLSRGGNILMVQVENEYGAYGVDKPFPPVTAPFSVWTKQATRFLT